MHMITNPCISNMQLKQYLGIEVGGVAGRKPRPGETAAPGLEARGGGDMPEGKGRDGGVGVKICGFPAFPGAGTLLEMRLSGGAV